MDRAAGLVSARHGHRIDAQGPLSLGGRVRLHWGRGRVRSACPILAGHHGVLLGNRSRRSGRAMAGGAVGAVVWLTSTVTMIMIQLFFDQVYGTDAVVVAAAVLAILAYLILSLLAARERPR